MRLIDAAETAKKMKEAFDIPMHDLVDVFAEISQVDAQLVVHAKWIKLKKSLYCEQRFKCSSCKGIVNDTHDFCPNCGARMDGENNAADV